MSMCPRDQQFKKSYSGSSFTEQLAYREAVRKASRCNYHRGARLKLDPNFSWALEPSYLYQKAPHESGLYLRWYADNIWLFVPVQQKLKAFLSTLAEFPFQQGSSLNAAGINYNSLQAMQAMKRLQQVESLSSPAN